MVDTTLDNISDEPKKEKKTNKSSEETLVKLEGMGFIEKEDKPNLYVKNIGDITFFWDFRKNKKGSAYASRVKEDGDGFDNVPRSELEQMEEYLILRPDKKKKIEEKEPEDKKPKALMIHASDKKAVELLRGSERDVIRLMDHRIQLDSIIEASSDPKKLGEGLLWHELKFGNRIHVEPSAELVDMISQDMGNITTRIVELENYVLTDPNTNEKYGTYYCVVEAKDELSGTTGLGVAEQIIDFADIKRSGRTFARTNAVRKAERNAKERLIPVPRKALVKLIVKKLEEHKKQQNLKM